MVLLIALLGDGNRVTDLKAGGPQDVGSSRATGRPGTEESDRDDLFPAAGERVLVPARDGASSLLVRVHGQVLGPDGLPMEDAIVAFRRGPERDTLLDSAVKTGGDGRYVAAVTPGDCTLVSRVATVRRGHGLRFEPRTVTIPAAREHLLDLAYTRPECRIGGLVSATGGRLVGEVGVSLRTLHARPLRRTASAADGRWEIDGIAPGLYRISLEKWHAVGDLLLPWRDSRARPTDPEYWPLLRVSPGDREITCNFFLATPVRVRGTISAPGPLTESTSLFMKQVRRNGGSVRFPGDRYVYSFAVDGAGRCLLDGIYPGTYQAVLLPGQDGIARPDVLEVSIDPERQDQEVLFSFAPCGGTCRLEGRLVDQEGRGIANARIELLDDGYVPETQGDARVFSRAGAVCDGEGRFTVVGLLPGSFRLLRDDRLPVMYDGAERAIVIDGVEPPLVTIEPGTTQATVTVHVSGRTTVRGKVEGFDSALPLLVTVAFRPAGGFAEYRTAGRVDREGGFLVPDVPLVDAPVTVRLAVELGEGSYETCLSREVLLSDQRGKPLLLARDPR